MREKYPLLIFMFGRVLNKGEDEIDVKDHHNQPQEKETDMLLRC